MATGKQDLQNTLKLYSSGRYCAVTARSFIFHVLNQQSSLFHFRPLQKKSPQGQCPQDRAQKRQIRHNVMIVIPAIAHDFT